MDPLRQSMGPRRRQNVAKMPRTTGLRRGWRLKTDMVDLFRSKGSSRGEKGTQAARGFGENGGGTSITTTVTGEREEQRRACCTSNAIPGRRGRLRSPAPRR